MEMQIEDEYVEVIFKDISSKLDLILESQNALINKIVAVNCHSSSKGFVDLKAHRADTKAYHEVYQVK